MEGEYILQIMGPRTGVWEDVEGHDALDKAIEAGDWYWERLHHAARILSPQRIVYRGVVAEEWDESHPDVLRELEWRVSRFTVRIYDSDRGAECRVLEILEEGGGTRLRGFDTPRDLFMYLVDIEQGHPPEELLPTTAVVYKRIGVNRSSLTVIISEAARSIGLDHGDPVRVTLERISPGRFVIRNEYGQVAERYDLPSEAIEACKKKNSHRGSSTHWEVWDEEDGVIWR